VHRPFGEQLEDGRTDIAAPAATTTAPVTAAATRTTGPEAEAATARVESEFEAATAGAEAGAAVVVTDVIAKVFAKLAPRLPTLLMQGATVEAAEAEAETAGGRDERVEAAGGRRE
jgi:hypothetical protein